MNRATDALLLLGRLLMAALFLPSGIGKVANWPRSSSHWPTRACPMRKHGRMRLWPPRSRTDRPDPGRVADLTAVLLIVFVAMATGTSHRY